MTVKTLKGVEIFCEIARETDGAILIDNGSSEHWIPKSQIIDMDRKINNAHAGKRDTATIIVPEWLAHERGLI